MKHYLIIGLLSFSALSLFGQEVKETDHYAHQHVHEHNHNKKFRLAGFIGHTLIKSEGIDKHIFIPSWGFDIDYWFTENIGIGLHNDIEIESFIYVRPDGEEIERINPLVLTLDGLYHVHNGLVFSAGPGVEIAHKEIFYLFRVGVEWEKEVGKYVDISPAIFYDRRFDGFSTFTIALGVGKRF